MEWEDTPADEARARRAAEIASLTGLRGFAALMVVLIHTSGRTEFDWLGLPIEHWKTYATAFHALLVEVQGTPGFD